MSNESYIQVPPDAAGKKISTTEITEVHFENEVITINIGDVISGDTSLVSATVLGVARIDAMEFYVLGTALFEAGETLRVAGQIVANVTVWGIRSLHTQNMIAVDPIFHHQKQRIDERGAASIRFTEGEQQFDAYGKTKVSEATTIGAYKFTSTPISDVYHDIIELGGVIGINKTESTCISSVGMVSGDKVIRTTNKYHIFQPYISQLISMSLVCGDAGKTGLQRRWGYFDEADGIYFEVNGTGELAIVLLSSAGDPIEKIYQSDWSEDKLDGTGRSEFDLDITKGNIYWIDIQWPVGRIRVGVYDNTGRRIVSHIIENANTKSRPYMKHPALPVRWEIENTAATGSSSELKFISASVQTEADFNPEQRTYGAHSAAEVTVGTTAYVPLLSFRPTLLFDGVANRVAAVLKSVQVISRTNPIRIDLTKNAVLTGATWDVSASADSAVEVDRTATSLTGGQKILSFVVPADGVSEEHMDNYIGYMSEYIKLHSDGVMRDLWTIKAKGIVDAAESEVFCSATWSELK